MGIVFSSVVARLIEGMDIRWGWLQGEKRVRRLPGPGDFGPGCSLAIRVNARSRCTSHALGGNKGRSKEGKEKRHMAQKPWLRKSAAWVDSVRRTFVSTTFISLAMTCRTHQAIMWLSCFGLDVLAARISIWLVGLEIPCDRVIVIEIAARDISVLFGEHRVAIQTTRFISSLYRVRITRCAPAVPLESSVGESCLSWILPISKRGSDQWPEERETVCLS